MRMVTAPATSAVPAAIPWGVIEPSSGTALPRIAGLTTRMYAIAKKVTRPPRTSRPKVEPLAEIWKKLSSARATALRDGAVLFCVLTGQSCP